MVRTISVTNLSRKVHRYDLKDLLSKCGYIADIWKSGREAKIVSFSEFLDTTLSTFGFKGFFGFWTESRACLDIWIARSFPFGFYLIILGI